MGEMVSGGSGSLSCLACVRVSLRSFGSISRTFGGASSEEWAVEKPGKPGDSTWGGSHRGRETALERSRENPPTTYVQ